MITPCAATDGVKITVQPCDHIRSFDDELDHDGERPQRRES